MALPAGGCIMIRVLGMAYLFPLVPAACNHQLWMSDKAQANTSTVCMVQRTELCLALTGPLKAEIVVTALTRRSVAVLAHMPNATVLMSHLIASIMSRMAMVAYGEPPAQQH